jgi:hypothetical protein
MEGRKYLVNMYFAQLRHNQENADLYKLAILTINLKEDGKVLGETFTFKDRQVRTQGIHFTISLYSTE